MKEKQNDRLARAAASSDAFLSADAKAGLLQSIGTFGFRQKEERS
jgi:hypothetical protein